LKAPVPAANRATTTLPVRRPPGAAVSGIEGQFFAVVGGAKSRFDETQVKPF
jgi:hypothetical protein